MITAQDLIKKYPKMCKENGKRGKGFKFGFEHDDGWNDLIDKLCYSIQSYLDVNKEVPQVVLFQVKEKFGGLRFYYNEVEVDNKHIAGEVSFAEIMSYGICEQCGTNQNVNRVKRRSWIKTLCKTCEVEWLKR